MTLRQLELFSLIYELRNLTRAAESLYMTQSAATQNLKKMEEELGVRLFERDKRQILPSPAGERFYGHARQILAEYRDSLAELAGLGEQLRFYYYEMPSSAIKDRVIAAFWALDPYLEIEQFDCRITELTDNSHWTPGALYLVPEEFIQDPEIRTVEAAAVQHHILMRENHPLSRKSRLRPEDLEGETILLRSRKSNHFHHLAAALDQLNERGIRYQTAVAERARELSPRILSFGGIAILPEYLIQEIPGITSRPYDDGIDVQVKLAYKGTPTPRVMKLLRAYEKKNAVQAQRKE